MVRISEAITEDHRELESLYRTIVNSEDADEQTRFQNQFTWELARHAVAEEMVVHPVIEKVLPDGKETTDRDRREHSTIKEMLDVFQDLNCSDARFLPTITVLMDGLTQHMREETVELVNLESYLALEESEQLAESLRSTKIFVPSQSHPEIRQPPYETAAGLLTAPLDHLQDLFKKWPEDKGDPME
ncbi:unnamed protein product [Penicillium salamii]|uniref:Hemerythrin-like domain-containing protein n=1 Tax=Penicillium salamii TaxID=1612424 RepID=A0A9W4J4S1_9EURO|nr:unnamed protein product [Penicillium salamii]CAG8032220.1 unnamed protein product [Penicillium salamii]CAG8179821.1 unnamed protein product [Penicillium salamii]CAG8260698.1 unnamed protein product [Penicillium salamii]CAG8266592.1 unnamed protein product [Penicillium salamii]